MSERSISLTVNGSTRSGSVDPRLTLADFLRERCRLTGTHLGCEHGVCGACTVLVDGAAIRSCLMFAVQADRTEVTTVESLSAPDAPLSGIPAAFRAEHGLQCGFCTPGIMMSLAALDGATDGGAMTPAAARHDQILDALSGHLCRCTGYRNIVRAADRALGVSVGDADD